MTVPVFASLAIIQVASNQIGATLFMYGAIAAIFYFLFIRPQQAQRKAHDQLVRQLKKGDEVVTAGGVIGEVVHIAQQGKDKEGASVASMEDRVTIKSGESRLIVERGRITRVNSGSQPAA